jgi:hypothetical protein
MPAPNSARKAAKKAAIVRLISPQKSPPKKRKSPAKNTSTISGDDSSRRMRQTQQPPKEEEEDRVIHINWQNSKYKDFTSDDIQLVKNYLIRYTPARQEQILKAVTSKRTETRSRETVKTYTYKNSLFDYMSEHNTPDVDSPVKTRTTATDLVGQSVFSKTEPIPKPIPIPHVTEQLISTQPVNLHSHQRMGQTVYTPVVLNTQGDEKFRIPASSKEPPRSGDPVLTGQYYQFLNKRRPNNNIGLTLRADAAYKHRVAQASTMY